MSMGARRRSARISPQDVYERMVVGHEYTHYELVSEYLIQCCDLTMISPESLDRADEAGLQMRAAIWKLVAEGCVEFLPNSKIRRIQ